MRELMSLWVNDLERQLMQASEHVAKGRRIVAEQQDRITQLGLLGRSVEGSQRTMSVFVSTLGLFEDHERNIRQELTAARAEIAKH